MKTILLIIGAGSAVALAVFRMQPQHTSTLAKCTNSTCYTLRG
jgi:hypothetical protein